MKNNMKIVFLLIASLSAVLSQVFASDFPVTFEHKFGTTVITEEPKNIATLDFQGADDLLALDIEPVVIRHWFGDYEQTVWPWAHEKFDKLTTKPVVIAAKNIDFEKIASAKPDVIFAMWSGITDKDYEKLSQIAPVVAVPKGMGNYAISWEQRALMIGKALGIEKKAQEKVDSIKKKITDIVESHPDWKGKTTAVAYYRKAGLGVYAKTAARTQLMEQMGFQLPKSLEDLSKKFSIKLSDEQIQLLDVDLLVWLGSTDKQMKDIENIEGRKFLNVYKDKREIFLDEIEVGAFSHSSLLSLPFALDGLVKKIETTLGKK